MSKIAPSWFGDSTVVCKNNAFVVSSPDGGRALFSVAACKDVMGEETGEKEIVLADWHAGSGGTRRGFGKSVVLLMAAVAHEEGVSRMRVFQPTPDADAALERFCEHQLLKRDDENGFSINSSVRRSAHQAFFENCDLKYEQALQTNNTSAASAWLTTAAHLQGFSLGPVWHGSPHQFTRFNVDLAGQTDDGYYGVGIYFSPLKESAEDYGPHITEALLRAKKPFYYYDSGVCGDIIKSREALAKLPFVDAHIKPNYAIPEGYQFHEHTRLPGSWGGEGLEYCVGPDPEHYDDPNAFYGQGFPTKNEAVVSFNDERNGVNYFDTGWATSLLKSVGRGDFTKRLAKAGYDAMVIVDDEGTNEVLVWSPNNIKSAKLVERSESGDIIPPSARFDKNTDDIRGAPTVSLAAGMRRSGANIKSSARVFA